MLLGIVDEWPLWRKDRVAHQGQVLTAEERTGRHEVSVIDKERLQRLPESLRRSVHWNLDDNPQREDSITVSLTEASAR